MPWTLARVCGPVASGMVQAAGRLSSALSEGPGLPAPSPSCPAAGLIPGCIPAHTARRALQLLWVFFTFNDISVCVVSLFIYVQLFATPVGQAPLSLRFSRQEHWSGLPFHPPGDLPDLGIELGSPVSPPLAGGFFNHCAPWEAQWPLF